jgi:hypothetical protein
MTTSRAPGRIFPHAFPGLSPGEGCTFTMWLNVRGENGGPHKESDTTV